MADKAQTGIFENFGSVIREKAPAKLLYLIETPTSINNIPI